MNLPSITIALLSMSCALAQDVGLAVSVSDYRTALEIAQNEITTSKSQGSDSKAATAALGREFSQPIGFSADELKVLARFPAVVAALKASRQSFLDSRAQALKQLQTIAVADRSKSALALSDSAGLRLSPWDVFTDAEVSAAAERFTKDTSAITVRGLRGARLLRRASTIAAVRAESFAAGFDFFSPPDTASIRHVIVALAKDSIAERIVLGLSTKDGRLYSGTSAIDVPKADLSLFSSSIVPQESNVGWIVMGAKTPYLDLRKMGNPADIEYPIWFVVPVAASPQAP